MYQIIIEIYLKAFTNPKLDPSFEVQLYCVDANSKNKKKKLFRSSFVNCLRIQSAE